MKLTPITSVIQFSYFAVFRDIGQDPNHRGEILPCNINTWGNGRAMRKQKGNGGNSKE